MIGGSGEKKTLRTVARYADMWNGMGTLETMTRKVAVLRQHCEDVGRDPAEIEFTLGIKATIRDSEAEAVKVWKAAMDAQPDAAHAMSRTTTPSGTAPPSSSPSGSRRTSSSGSRPLISEQPAPYDTETLERLIGQVKPLVDRG